MWKEALGLDFEFKDRYDIDDLCEIMKILRSDNGCPWDKVQTHSSIRKDFIEECYEAVEAIDADDPAMMREELGDVLLQVVFHCRIEEEKNNFTFGDAVNDVCEKLIVRHPHVFGTTEVGSTDEVLKNWEAVKQHTKGQTKKSESLESVCGALPALMRAQKLCSRAKRAGAVPAGNDELIRKISVQAEALKESASGEIIGRLMFLISELAWNMDIDAEECLTRSSDRFVDSFKEAEEKLEGEGKTIDSLAIYDLDA